MQPAASTDLSRSGDGATGIPVRVSVALCTYNGARHLVQQLDSLLAQDFADFEIVAVDDNSSDSTWELLQAYARRDPRFRLYRNERNLGHRHNFEKALTLCRGELLAPCDQDDIWLPGKLSRLVGAMDGVSVAYCDSELVDANGASLGRRISDQLNMYEGGDPSAFVFTNCVSGHAMLLRREVLQAGLPFPEVGYHDWWLAFVAATRQGLRYVPEPLVKFRQHAASSTDIARLKQRDREERQDRLRLYEERAFWLAALARFPGAQQDYFLELFRAHVQLEHRWFSLEMWRLLWSRRKSLFFIDRKASSRLFGMTRRFSTGIKARYLFSKGYPRRPIKLPALL